MLRRWGFVAVVAPWALICCSSSYEGENAVAPGDDSGVISPAPVDDAGKTKQGIDDAGSEADGGGTKRKGPLPQLDRCGDTSALPTEKLPLDLKVTLGTVATVSGNDVLLNKIAAYSAERTGAPKCLGPAGFTWPGYTIDWGDDPANTRINVDDQPLLGGGCSDLTKHSFLVPGRYLVRGSAWHPGPTDMKVYDYSAVTEVDVPFPEVDAKTTLELIDPLANTTIYYEGNIPITWDWRPTQKYRIEVAIVTDANIAIAAKTLCATGYNGKGKYELSTASTSLNAILKNGAVAARTRIRLLDGDEIAFERISDKKFTYTPQMDPSHWTLDLKPTTGHGVKLNLQTYEPVCISYRVEWGDGTAPTVKEQTPPAGGCPIDSQVIPIPHTYAKAGTYTVKVTTTEYDFGRKLDDVAAYTLGTVVVP